MIKTHKLSVKNNITAQSYDVCIYFNMLRKDFEKDPSIEFENILGNGFIFKIKKSE